MRVVTCALVFYVLYLFLFFFMPFLQNHFYLCLQLFSIGDIGNIPGCKYCMRQSAKGILRRRVPTNIKLRLSASEIVQFYRASQDMLKSV